MKKYLCKICQKPLVDFDKNGKQAFGQHEWWCPAANPDRDTPARTQAIKKLVCGSDCPFKDSAITDAGVLAICEKCPNQLARAAINTNIKRQKIVEVVFPAKPKRPSVIPLKLYLDALERITLLQNELDQLKRVQR